MAGRRNGHAHHAAAVEPLARADAPNPPRNLRVGPMTWLSPSSKTHPLAWLSIESCMAHVIVVGEILIFAADGFRWPSSPGGRAGLVGGWRAG
jgi:hypothetical protein